MGFISAQTREEGSPVVSAREEKGFYLFTLLAIESVFASGIFLNTLFF